MDSGKVLIYQKRRSKSRNMYCHFKTNCYWVKCTVFTLTNSKPLVGLDEDGHDKHHHHQGGLRDKHISTIINCNRWAIIIPTSSTKLLSVGPLSQLAHKCTVRKFTCWRDCLARPFPSIWLNFTSHRSLLRSHTAKSTKTFRTVCEPPVSR